MHSEHFKLVRIVVVCVTVICLVAVVGGIFLSFKGYTEAQMLIQVSSAGVGGLLGIISMRGGAAPTTVTGNDATVITPSAQPPA